MMNNIQNPWGRSPVSLAGDWHYIVDPYETGFIGLFGGETDRGYFLNQTPADHWASEYDFANSPVLKVPGDWNTQIPELFWYEGTMWYYRELPEVPMEGVRTFLRFEGANYATIVWVNGRELLRHTGGFTPFEGEITHLLRGQGNYVVVKVSNERLNEGVPTKNTDWWNYGGLTRDVLLIQTPRTFIRDYVCQLDPDQDDRITGFVQLDGPDTALPVTLRIGDLDIHEQWIPDETGKVPFSIPARPKRWSPQSPALYDVEISCQDDCIRDRIGFRTITVEGEDILLNGESVFLHGISTHEEAVTGPRRAFSEDDARDILSEVQALGCNFARLAHYPHNEFMSRVADEMGILLWCEIPVYWSIDWTRADVLDNATQQLREMIRRDRNRASIILWSLANETPVGTERTTFIRHLADTAKSLDPTRLTTAAMFMRPEKIQENGRTVRTYTLDDPLAEFLDVMGCNQYLGWYYTRVEDIAGARWISGQNKPLIMSEFGAGAPAGRRGPRDERWTEDYQQRVYEEQLAMMDQISFLRGLSPWILKDFRTPKRPLAGVQDYFNRKGLISEKGERKLAWQTLHDYYRTRVFPTPTRPRPGRS